LDNACRETALGRRVPAGFALTGISASPDGETLAILTRSFSPERGVRAVLRLVGRSAIDSASAPLLDELAISEPLTRDNYATYYEILLGHALRYIENQRRTKAREPSKLERITHDVSPDR
jgi:hypothetical protein